MPIEATGDESSHQLFIIPINDYGSLPEDAIKQLLHEVYHMIMVQDKLPEMSWQYQSDGTVLLSVDEQYRGSYVLYLFEKLAHLKLVYLNDEQFDIQLLSHVPSSPAMRSRLSDMKQIFKGNHFSLEQFFSHFQAEYPERERLKLWLSLQYKCHAADLYDNVFIAQPSLSMQPKLGTLQGNQFTLMGIEINFANYIQKMISDFNYLDCSLMQTLFFIEAFATYCQHLKSIQQTITIPAEKVFTNISILRDQIVQNTMQNKKGFYIDISRVSTPVTIKNTALPFFLPQITHETPMTFKRNNQLYMGFKWMRPSITVPPHVHTENSATAMANERSPEASSTPERQAILPKPMLLTRFGQFKLSTTSIPSEKKPDGSLSNINQHSEDLDSQYKLHLSMGKSHD